MLHLSPLQQALSWLFPVRVRTGKSQHHALLELFRYRGRWQLATEDALYSDGAAYSPLRKAFRALRADAPGWDNVLVLGTGLGSAVWVLAAQGLRPQVTLVDWDETVLQWAIETLEAGGHADHVEVICDDATRFVVADDRQYDVVIVDLFQGRVAPPFATSPAFLQQCAARLVPEGILILNYIENQPGGAAAVEAALRAVFEHLQIIRHGINRIYLARTVAA